MPRERGIPESKPEVFNSLWNAATTIRGICHINIQRYWKNENVLFGKFDVLFVNDVHRPSKKYPENEAVYKKPVDIFAKTL